MACPGSPLWAAAAADISPSASLPGGGKEGALLARSSKNSRFLTRTEGEAAVTPRVLCSGVVWCGMKPGSFDMTKGGAWRRKAWPSGSSRGQKEALTVVRQWWPGTQLRFAGDVVHEPPFPNIPHHTLPLEPEPACRCGCQLCCQH